MKVVEVSFNPSTYSTEKCLKCFGTGQRSSRGKDKVICFCVLRKIFRASIWYKREAQGRSNKYRGFAYSIGFSRISVNEIIYHADIWLAAKECLIEKDFEIFKYHYVDGLPWFKVAPKVRLDRGNFFHRCYVIEWQVGKKLIEKGIFPYATYLRQAFEIRKLVA